MDVLVHLRKKTAVGGTGRETVGESAPATSLWGVLYADTAGDISQSLDQLRKNMGVIVVVCSAVGLTVSEAMAGILCLRAKRMPESTTIFSLEAAGQVYNQTNEVVNLGRIVNLSIEVKRRRRNACCSFRKYISKLYDRRSAPLELRIRMLRAEALETILHGWLRRVEPTQVPL